MPAQDTITPPSHAHLPVGHAIFLPASAALSASFRESPWHWPPGPQPEMELPAQKAANTA